MRIYRAIISPEPQLTVSVIYGDVEETALLLRSDARTKLLDHNKSIRKEDCNSLCIAKSAAGAVALMGEQLCEQAAALDARLRNVRSAIARIGQFTTVEVTP